MTREEAIEILEANRPDPCYQMLREAVDFAVDALKAQLPSAQPKPCEDAVSRADAFNAINDYVNTVGVLDGYTDTQEVLRIVKRLPSAQPEKVKCKKCRYVYYDKEFGNYWCNRKPDSFMVEEDGYCKWGK